MGVGKSTVGKLLTEKLPDSVLLEGDWCWNYAVNNAETRQIAVDNACDIVNRYLKSQSYRNIVFCWVFPFQSVWEQFLSRLQTPCDIVKVCLTCQQNQTCKPSATGREARFASARCGATQYRKTKTVFAHSNSQGGHHLSFAKSGCGSCTENVILKKDVSSETSFLLRRKKVFSLARVCRKKAKRTSFPCTCIPKRHNMLLRIAQAGQCNFL